ncbi:MAG: hypothetical protein ISS13_03085 [Actinobacteria bacterium]|nr:hypothetical protein [Actinomycetota bacterium]MBL7060804.1 hypothetical protein [Actinomycetota bacterium]
MMQNQLIITIVYYISIAAIFIFTLLSLLLTDKKKKLLYFSLTLLFWGTLNLVLLSGVLFFLIYIVIMIFYILFYMYFCYGEFYRCDEISVREKELYNKKVIRKKLINKSLSLALPIFLCGGIGCLFFSYTLKFFREHNEGGNIQIMNFSVFLGELYSNYMIPVILLISVLFISVLWFIIVIGKNKEKNKKE